MFNFVSVSISRGIRWQSFSFALSFWYPFGSPTTHLGAFVQILTNLLINSIQYLYGYLPILILKSWQITYFNVHCAHFGHRFCCHFYVYCFCCVRLMVVCFVINIIGGDGDGRPACGGVWLDERKRVRSHTVAHADSDHSLCVRGVDMQSSSPHLGLRFAHVAQFQRNFVYACKCCNWRTYEYMHCFTMNK